MKRYLNKLLSLLQACLIPTCCEHCRARVINHASLCQICKNKIASTLPACKICHLALEKGTICGGCITMRPAFEKVYILGDYQAPLSELITQLKFHEKLNCARALADLFIEKIPAWYSTQTLPSLIIPVPLHKKRLRQRGFNQTLEIARPVAIFFNLSLEKFNCVRIKATQAQLSLPPKTRRSNVANAFKILTPIKHTHVAILDDVFTTGHTVNELAKALKRCGILRIDVWCCARTQLK